MFERLFAVLCILSLMTHATLDWDDNWRGRLIALVRDRPSLWNYTDPSYGNKAVKQNDWDAIGDALSSEFQVTIKVMHLFGEIPVKRDR